MFLLPANCVFCLFIYLSLLPIEGHAGNRVSWKKKLIFLHTVLYSTFTFTFKWQPLFWTFTAWLPVPNKASCLFLIRLTGFININIPLILILQSVVAQVISLAERISGKYPNRKVMGSNPIGCTFSIFFFTPFFSVRILFSYTYNNNNNTGITYALFLCTSADSKRGERRTL